LSARLNKEELLKEFLGQDATAESSDTSGPAAFAPKQTLEQAAAKERANAWALCGGENTALKAELREKLIQLLRKGLDNQVGLHVYDQGVPFDLNLATFLGQMLGSFNGSA